MLKVIDIARRHGGQRAESAVGTTLAHTRGLTHGGSLHGYHSSTQLQLTVYLKSDNPQSFDANLYGVTLRRGIYTR